MRRILVLVPVCIALVALGLRAQLRSRVAVGLEAIQAAQLRQDLTYLSSDELQGRLSLTPGSELAIDWIAREFQKAGLKPAAGSSFRQVVPLIEYRTDRQKSGLIISRGGADETYHFPDAYGNFPDPVAVKGAVVFAGYGITAPELSYDDYRGINTKGKIVLIFDHEPQEDDPRSIFNGRGNTRYANAFPKLANAQQHGAIGVLVVAEPNRKHPSAQERMARIAGTRERQARIPSEALVDGGPKIPMFTISDKLAAELISAAGRKPSDLQSSIDANLKPASVDLPGVTVQMRVVTSERREANSANVAGLLEGGDPRLNPETIVISAHYDHDGMSADGGIFHGADDNGSGTVGVVELARAFVKNPVKPRRSILFLVFAAEERGLLGSYYYVSHPLRSLETTRAVINFDMIGRNETPSRQTDGLVDVDPDTSDELALIGTNYSPEYRKTVERDNNMVGLKLIYKWDQEPALNVFFRSDHFPFALHNIPAVWWFTGFHPDYHQTTDTVEKINFAKMEKILKLAYLSAFDFAELDPPPAFKPRVTGPRP